MDEKTFTKNKTANVKYHRNDVTEQAVRYGLDAAPKLLSFKYRGERAAQTDHRSLKTNMSILTRLIIFASIVAVPLILISCLSTAPDGKGSTDEKGNERATDEMLPIGAKAPSFEALDNEGNKVRSGDFLGKKNVVLVFYPGDDTPGCTQQLCTIRDDWERFTGKDVAVFGVNPAGVDSKAAFSNKYTFPFPLLADTEGEMVRKYGCRGPLGVVTRTVYGIDKEGKIAFAERGMPSTKKILEAL